MKYGITAFLFTKFFDKDVINFISSKDIISLNGFKKKLHQEYKKMVRRTPGIDKKNDLIGTLYMGCYILSVYKACEGKMREEEFSDLVEVLCHSKIMVNAHKDADPFDDKYLKNKEEWAEKLKNSDNEMDWRYFVDIADDTRCGLCELGKKEGLQHLIRYLCKADFITYEMMGASLQRTHTIANGDEYCDFHIERKKVNQHSPVRRAMRKPSRRLHTINTFTVDSIAFCKDSVKCSLSFFFSTSNLH